MTTVTPTPVPPPPFPAPSAPVHPAPGWSTALGVLLIVAGVLAIVFPLVASITTALFVGWLLIVIGIAQIVHAFTARGWRGALWYGAVGLVFLVGGGLIAFDPLAGAVTLTVWLAAVFLVEGVLEIVAGLSMRDRPNWGWVAASGIAALLAGGLIALQLPYSGLWVVGFLTGVNFIFSGIAYLMHRVAVN